MKPVLTHALLLFTAIAAMPAWAADAQPATLRFNAAQLQDAAEAGFPMQRDLLEGFATLTLSAPKVRIPVPGERIQLELDYDVKLAGSSSAEAGRFTVASGVRYDPATRGLHLSDPQLQDFTQTSSRTGLDAGTRGMVNALMQEYARSRPLYQLTADDLAQVPGQLTADSLRVRDGQVELQLTPQAVQ